MGLYGGSLNLCRDSLNNLREKVLVSEWFIGTVSTMYEYSV